MYQLRYADDYIAIAIESNVFASVHNKVIAKNNLTTKKAIYFHSSAVDDLHQLIFLLIVLLKFADYVVLFFVCFIAIVEVIPFQLERKTKTINSMQTENARNGTTKN